MALTQDQINTLKKLTALSGTKEINIESVLASFESISSVDTSHITTSSRSGKWSLIPREDIVIPSMTDSDDLLACSKQRVVAHQIALSSIMHGE